MTLPEVVRKFIRSALPHPILARVRALRLRYQDQQLARVYARSARAERHIFGQISFSPRLPSTENAIAKICHELKWAIELRSLGSRTRLVVFWPQSEFRFPPQPTHWINSRCLNIDKSRVAKASEKAFGMSYLLDPSTHTGPMVVKSDRNATHDGSVLDGPQERKRNCIYMRCIDNVYGDEVQDIRVIFMNRVLPFAYLKYRPLTSRFSNTNSRAEIVDTEDVISSDENSCIVAMCKDIGMDYGEIDCLRDRSDGLLYVIDMNRTPAGPPNGLPEDQARKAVQLMARSFIESFGGRPPAVDKAAKALP